MQGSAPPFVSDTLEHDFREIVGERPVGHLALRGLDELLGGLHAVREIVLGGGPGTGKSTLVNQLACDAARDRHPALILSLEMTRQSYVAKGIIRNSEGSLRLTDLPRLDLGSDGSAYLRSAYERYASEVAPRLSIIAKTADPFDAVETIRSFAEACSAVPIVFVDYGQALAQPRDMSFSDERSFVQFAAMSLRRCANEVGCPLFVVSSVNRASYDKATAGLDCLAGSSALEYSADAVLLLSVSGKGAERRRNQELPLRPVTATLLKNRYGPLGSIGLVFDTEHASFYEG